MIKLKTIAVIFGTVFLFLYCTTKEPQTPEKPNILLIVSEDNGPDLGCYGNTHVYTPNLDRLAAEGVQFNNAFVTYSVCSPSRGTIFTGLYPHQNGQIGLATHKYRMYEGIKTLPKYLREVGYFSGCIGKVHVNPESEIPWDYRPGGLLNGSNFGKKSLPEYATKAMEFVRQSAEKPFFLMVNFPDAHFPVQYDVEGLPTKELEPGDVDGPLDYVGANSEYLREYTANYFNCMNRLDESVGMLLDSLKKSDKADNTIIIYLGDHGAQFSRGKCSNYEAALKIPFIMHWPNHIKSDIQKEELISTIDLLPTILDLAGAEKPEFMQGKSLMALAKNKETEWAEYVFAGGTGSAPFFYYPRRSVRDKQFKLIYNVNYQEENPHVGFYNGRQGHFVAGTNLEETTALDTDMAEVYRIWRNPPQYELYDLINDPLEFKNLSDNAEFSEELERLKKVLKLWQIETNDPFNDPVKHQRYNQDIKDIAEKYEGTSYRNDPDFKWKYVDYFQD
ncbi:MAG: sulfatase [Prolixibacteraceae bacterium]|nr:sulfatase [Prolixibacteraceae bacterium]MBT6004789.1 sulfatase [Prolixibacteraceae bacterium]MBT7394171.1 sulfatase [Prolixibacteraceae bacterium]